MKLLRLAALAAFGFVLIAGCDPPTAPGKPAGPDTNNATVTARAPGTCPAIGPCLADYSVSVGDNIVRIIWSFPAAAPSESGIATGTTRYPGPGTYGWDNLICTQTAAADPTNASCRPANDFVTFVLQ